MESKRLLLINNVTIKKFKIKYVSNGKKALPIPFRPRINKKYHIAL